MELVLGDDRINKLVPSSFKRIGWLNSAILFGMDVPQDQRSFCPSDANVKAAIDDVGKRFGPVDSFFMDEHRMSDGPAVECMRKIKTLTDGKKLVQFGPPGTPGNARNFLLDYNFPAYTNPVIWSAHGHLDTFAGKFSDAIMPQLYLEVGVEKFTAYENNPVEAAKQLFTVTLFLARVAAHGNCKPLWPIVQLADEHQRTKENARWIRDLCVGWGCERMIGWGPGAELFF